MPKFYFLSSYSKLSEYVEGLRSTLLALPNEKYRERILVEVALFAINKHSPDELRLLQANDYLTSIIGVSAKITALDMSELLSVYDQVVKCLLPLEDLEAYSLGPINKGRETKVFFNRDSKKSCFFLIASIELTSYLCGHCETLSKANYESLNNKSELEILFEDPNTGISIKVDPFGDPHDFKTAIVASLYTLIAYLLNYKPVFQDNEFSSSIAKELAKNGYVFIPNFFDLNRIRELKKITYSIANSQIETGAAYVYGNDASLQRIYNLIGKSDIYWDFLLDERVQSIVETFFNRNTLHDKYYLSSYQANILYPGAAAQILHTDLSMPEPLPPWPVRLNINLVIDDFTVLNGATLVVPGSHLWLKKPNALGEEVNLTPVTVPCGSLVIWSGHLWHKSGANRSNKPRAALLACFAASYLRELAVEENYLQINSNNLLNRMPRILKALIGGFHGIKKGA